MKILLLGCRGQVGWELQRALAVLGDVTALAREGREGLRGDLEHIDDLRRTVRRLGPALIANAAAYTDVDRAEAEPARAERVNAEAPGVLAAEAARLDAWLVHYSTDYIFDGSGAAPWREDDAPAPLNVYGATKWRGEQAVRDSGCRHLIFRTQWVYASRGRNFVGTMLALAAERHTLEVANDQTGAPTGADLVADVTAHAVRQAVAQPKLAGTYHLAARGETSRHAYARFVVDAARRAGRPVCLSDAGIVPTSSTRSETGAERPRNCRLDVARLERNFGLAMPDWRSGVVRAVAEYTGELSESGIVAR